MKKNNLSLTIGWLYPDLMSTYGDRGNIIVLTKRSELRGIKVEVKKITIENDKKELLDSDLIFMGGAQDQQQEIVNRDLLDNKGENLKLMINKDVPGLFICGAYQFLGKYYKAADGTIINGLSIFDLYTENPGSDKKRLIGDIIIKTKEFGHEETTLVGFENHGGRTYLGEKVRPFAFVVYGFGNNGQDKTEGIIYKNAVGSYLHGPILSKNPELADFLIEKALLNKYKKSIRLEKIDDRLEIAAKKTILKRYGKD